MLHVDLDVVLQVGADAGEVRNDRQVEPAQGVGLADAGQHQELRRIDRAAAQDHFAPGAREAHRAAAGVFDPDCAPAFEYDAQRQAARQHAQVGTPHGRPQIGAHRAPATAAQRGLVHRAEPFLPEAVHVARVGITGLLGCFDEGMKQRIAHRGRRDRQRSAGAVVVVGSLQAVFAAHEVRQAVRVRPVGQSRPLRPAVVVERMAPDVDHSVDRRRAAQHPAARAIHPASVHRGLGFGVVVPVVAVVRERHRKRRRHPDENAVIGPSGLQHGQLHIRVLAQAVGQHAAGRPGPDDHVVEFLAGPHRGVIAFSTGRRCGRARRTRS